MKKWGGQLDIRPPTLKIGGDVSPPSPPRIDAPDFICKMARKHRRIPVVKVFLTRKLSKRVRTSTKANVLQRDHQKIKWHVTIRQQGHEKFVQLHTIIRS